MQRRDSPITLRFLCSLLFKKKNIDGKQLGHASSV